MTQPPRVALLMRNSMRAAALCICWAAAVSGCAAFGKCGLHECPADARISDEVRALFAQSPSLGSPNLISVQTLNGIVYLRGLVSTPYQIAEAESLAQQAAGVSGVQNMLSIDNSR